MSLKHLNKKHGLNITILNSIKMLSKLQILAYICILYVTKYIYTFWLYKYFAEKSVVD